MKRIPAKDLETNVDAVLTSAQSERIIISRRGKPCAILVGVENYDTEDLRLAGSSEFWSMIRKRRTSGKSIPLVEVEERLETRGKQRVKKKSVSKKRRNRS